MDPPLSSTAQGKRQRTTPSSTIPQSDPTSVYDPFQPLDERRRVQRALRALNVQLTTSDTLLKPGDPSLLTVLESSNEISKNIRQTAEAAIDSKLQITVADLLHRKTVHFMSGPSAEGVDVDGLIGKVRGLMRRGEERGVSGWVHVGEFAAVPAGGRGAVAGFLLGPLGTEKKSRKVAKRSAPLRANEMVETRPEVLNTEDLAKVDNDLTVICAQVLQRLAQLQDEIQTELEELLDERMAQEEQFRLMHSKGLRATGGIDLMRFVVNPESYSQTVENMFYLSFLVRDGQVQLEFDDMGIPSVSVTEGYVPGTQDADAKRQAIFTLDKGTWREIVEVLGIMESMIPHRAVRTQQPGATGWYS